MLLLKGGHQCEFSLNADAPLLRELFAALRNPRGNEGQKLFRVPMESGKSCLYFPGESLVAIATDPPVPREAIAVEKRSPSATNHSKTVQQLEWQLEIYRQLEKLSPNHGKIERITKIPRAEFLEKYYATNTPVIFTDLMHNWPALSLWTPEYFREKYGDAMVGVQVNRESNPDYEIERDKHQVMMSLGTFVDKVINGGETNDYYIGAYNGTFHRPKMQGLFADMEMFSEYLEVKPDPAQMTFWFGPAGTITPLHFDSLNTFLCQVYGRKRIKLISPNHKHLLYNRGRYHSYIDLENPDYEQFPLLENVNIIETVLEPGEVLFMPVGWWHHVKALDIAVSVSLMNFVFPNEYE
ncbi:cupin-like domain-containing protein [Phormidium sp. CCY1219]|uniref:cupin-like domain-containing protein n=1 Tax=Phormidium sp. CCY1219 TaxID=2886104 RepID=UPI002D1F7DC1|nr:cupin-like domain-containing protein [Phormidium sp. CCY1219]MEB3828530.1 cupin-like domain-containing protein [Phormidium sp. CCY1219]